MLAANSSLIRLRLCFSLISFIPFFDIFDQHKKFLIPELSIINSEVTFLIKKLFIGKRKKSHILPKKNKMEAGIFNFIGLFPCTSAAICNNSLFEKLSSSAN